MPSSDCVKMISSACSNTLRYRSSLPCKSLVRAVTGMYEKVVKLSRTIPDDHYVAAINIDHPGWLADFVVSDLDVQRADADRSLVEVSFRIEGRGNGEDLAEVLGRIDGVTSVKLAAGD